jgi:hypothetical protein
MPYLRIRTGSFQAANSNEVTQLQSTALVAVELEQYHIFSPIQLYS